MMAKTKQHRFLTLLLWSRVIRGFQSPPPVAHRSHRHRRPQHPPLRAFGGDDLVNSDLLALVVSGGLVGGLAFAVNQVSKAVDTAPKKMAPEMTVNANPDPAQKEAAAVVEARAVVKSQALAEAKTQAETLFNAEEELRAAAIDTKQHAAVEAGGDTMKEGNTRNERSTPPTKLTETPAAVTLPATEKKADASPDPLAESVKPIEPSKQVTQPEPVTTPITAHAPSKEVLESVEWAQAHLRKTTIKMNSMTTEVSSVTTPTPAPLEKKEEEVASTAAPTSAVVETTHPRGKRKVAKGVGLVLVAGAAVVVGNVAKAFFGKGML